MLALISLKWNGACYRAAGCMIPGPSPVMISSFARREPPPAQCAAAADTVEGRSGRHVGDADAARSSAALAALLADPQTDAVLLLNLPAAPVF